MAANLTDQEKQKARITFDKYDTNKNGTIEKNEFVEMLKEVLEIDPSNTQKFLDFKFKQIDTDQSASISFDEFLVYYAKAKEEFQ